MTIKLYRAFLAMSKLSIKKAFDTVCYSKLLVKSKFYGIFENIGLLSWTEAFLCGRSQSVRVGSCISSKISVISGIPQRSVGGGAIRPDTAFDLYNWCHWCVSWFICVFVAVCWCLEIIYVLHLAKLQPRIWLPRALSSCLAVCWPGAQCARDNHVLACNFCQIFTDLKQFSLTDLAIYLVIKTSPHLKYVATPPGNLSLMTCFADNNVSQGSLATCAIKCPFNCKFTKESSFENSFKSVKIWQNYGHESVAPIFGPPCMSNSLDSLKFQAAWAHGSIFKHCRRCWPCRCVEVLQAAGLVCTSTRSPV